MARVPGVAPKPTARPRFAAIKVTHNLNPLVPLVIFGPVVMVAPDDFIRAVVLAVVLICAWSIGYFEGRSALSRELLEKELNELRRDHPAA